MEQLNRPQGLNMNIKPEDLKDIVGWKSDQTVSVYNHMLPETATKLIQKLPQFQI